MAKGKNKKRAKAAKAKALPVANQIPKHNVQRLKSNFIWNAKNFRLLKLPAEIRVMIYLYALGATKSVLMVSDNAQISDCQHRRSSNPVFSHIADQRINRRPLAHHRVHPRALLNTCHHIRDEIAALPPIINTAMMHAASCIKELSAVEKATVEHLRLFTADDPFSCLLCRSGYVNRNLQIASQFSNLKEVTLRIKQGSAVDCSWHWPSCMYNLGPDKQQRHVRRVLGMEQQSDVAIRLEVQLLDGPPGSIKTYFW